MNYMLSVVIAILLAIVTYQFFGGSGRLTPVSQNTVITKRAATTDYTDLGLSWLNTWADGTNCRFVPGSLSAVQGDLSDFSSVRDGITADYGKPVGPRGRGPQRTGDIPWRFYRPSEIIGPNFILRVWHRCTDADGSYEVQSIMLDIPIEEVFPPQ